MLLNTPIHTPNRPSYYDTKRIISLRGMKKEIPCIKCGWGFKPLTTKQRKDKICPDHEGEL